MAFALDNLRKHKNITSPLKKYRAHIEANGINLPVDVILERRLNVRFGITTGRKITLRLPLGYQMDAIHAEVAKLEAWVQETFAKKPALRGNFERKMWQTGDVLQVGERLYRLDIRVEERDTHTARLDKGTILIKLGAKSNEDQRAKAVKTLLSRTVASDFAPEITRRVLDWNDRTVKKHIQSVNLKYNHSNWGSCSTNHNINLSTRLLFAPQAVQDYVILHELAHLVEHNHSDRFWALVERFMPNYQEMERWLKKHRSSCDFEPPIQNPSKNA